jgi:xanthine dehydrogenase accessory factor
LSELNRILEACAEARGQETPGVLATVVRVLGSAYRRPGARMLFRRGRPAVGLISGGCLEEDLALRTSDVLDSGQARTVVYDMRSPDDIVWGLGLGCNGEVRVLLERLTAESGYLDFLEACCWRGVPAVLATVFEVQGSTDVEVGTRIAFDETGGLAQTATAQDRLCERVAQDAGLALQRGKSFNSTYQLEGDACVEVLIEYVAPPVSLVVFGAGMDALPVVQGARQLGWQVTVADHRPAYANQELVPLVDAVTLLDYEQLPRDLPSMDGNTAVLVMTHHFLHDLDLLEQLLPSAAPYVGVLGPQKRSEKLLEQLAQRGLRPTPQQLDRFHGPVGVDMGSETPEEIALSALAEIQAVLRGRAAGFLRDRQGPLHEPA